MQEDKMKKVLEAAKELQVALSDLGTDLNVHTEKYDVTRVGDSSPRYIYSVEIYETKRVL